MQLNEDHAKGLHLGINEKLGILIMNKRNKEAKNKSYGPFSGTASRTLAFDLTQTIWEEVPAALYEHVKLRAEQNVRCLSNQSYLKAEDLIGADCWDEFDAEEKRMAGVCIGHLYQSGALPLAATEFGLTPPTFYYLDSGEGPKSN